MNFPPHTLGRRIGTLAGAAVILLAVAWIYHPALHGTWLWDDDLEITANTVLRDPRGWLAAWIAPVGLDYFPLKSTLQWLEWHRWAARPAPYHAVNIALHAIGALLVWALLRKVFVAERASVSGLAPGPVHETLARSATGWEAAAWFGGLIFAVHPVAVESVAWISEFKNVLSLPLLLLAAMAWVDWDAMVAERASVSDPPRSGSRRAFGRNAGAFRYLAALGGFLLAMLCKTTPVVFPVVILLYAWWRRGKIGRADWLAALPFFAISLVLGAVTYRLQIHRAVEVRAPASARLTQVGWNAFAYLRESLWPADLMPAYPPAAWPWPAAAGWLILAAVGAAICLGRKHGGRAAALGLGWFFLNLLPVLGLVTMSYLRVAPRADHLAYIPLVGLAGLAAAAIGRLAEWWADSARRSGLPRRRLAKAGAPYLLAGVGCLALALASHSYAAAFRSPAALWTLAHERNPDSWLVCNNLGRAWLDQGRLAEAAPLFERAIRDGPPSAETHTNLGYIDEAQGRAAAAGREYKEAIRLDPGFAGAHYNYGHLLLMAGESAGAAVQFRAALRTDPGSAAAHNNLGLVLSRLGDASGALAEYRAALELNPRLADAWVNLGNAQVRAGRQVEAIASYRTALQADPRSYGAHHNLGMVLREEGREDEARTELAAAAALRGR